MSTILLLLFCLFHLIFVFFFLHKLLHSVPLPCGNASPIDGLCGFWSAQSPSLHSASYVTFFSLSCRPSPCRGPQVCGLFIRNSGQTSNHVRSPPVLPVPGEPAQFPAESLLYSTHPGEALSTFRHHAPPCPQRHQNHNSPATLCHFVLSSQVSQVPPH